MQIYVAIAAEGDHHLGLEAADAFDQLSGDPDKVLARQLTVGISQYLPVVNIQHAQSGSELLPPQSGQLVAATGSSPGSMPRVLPSGKPRWSRLHAGGPASTHRRRPHTRHRGGR